MKTGFGVLSVLTAIFQLVCAITLVVGIALIVDGSKAPIQNDATSQMANNPFTQAFGNPYSQVSAIMKIGGGAVLALFGLAGLVFSGGIHVLIAIENNTHSLSQAIPAALAALQNAISINRRISSETSSPEITRCGSCNSVNESNGQFCEHCGKPLN